MATYSSSIDGPEGLASLSALYSPETRLRAIIDSVLGGHLGSARADDLYRPGVARLCLGCYAIFAGDPALPLAEELIRDLRAPVELIVPRDGDWDSLARSVHADRIVERPMQAFSAANLRLPRLREIAASIPTGFEIQHLDASLADQLGDDLSPHGMQVMNDTRDFSERSGGVGALSKGRLVGAATNYAFSAKSIEVAISTHPDHRGQGIASCLAATWIVHCLEQTIVPHWNASNPVSKRLARRLGYIPAETVNVLLVERDPGS